MQYMNSSPSMTMILQPDLCPSMKRPQVWQPLYTREPTPPVAKRPHVNYGELWLMIVANVLILIICIIF